MTPPSYSNRLNDGPSAQRRHGFTLLELVVVMALLTVVFGLVAPSLSQFFRGRNLNSEANRLLALTRYGQSRAVTEGVPMELWVDARNGRYGLQADNTYLENDPREEHFNLAEKLQLDIQLPVIAPPSGQWWQQMSTGTSLQSVLWGQTEDNSQDNRPKIRFTPDGRIAATSPDRVGIRDLRDKNGHELWLTRSRSGSNYEIQTDIR